MLPVETPFKIYTGLTGQPLNNGYVYFGVANQNPITSPITVYWDAAGTQPAAQPLRTVNGYIVRAGTPANVFVGVSYSELVKDASGRQVFYARNSDDFSIGTAILNFLATLAASGGSALIGFIQAGVGAVLRTVQDKLRDEKSLFDFMTAAQIVDVRGYTYAVDVTAAVQAAIDYATPLGIKLRAPAGGYKFLNGLTKAQSFQCFSIDGDGYLGTVFDYSALAPNSSFMSINGGSGTLTGAEISGIQFKGNATSIAAEIDGQGGLIFSRCQFGLNTRGLLLHNKSAGNFTEFVIADDCDFTALCETPLEYRVTAGNNSFHGSGLRGNCTVNGHASGTPTVLVGAGCLPYNAPLSLQLWPATAQVLIQNNNLAVSLLNCNWYGAITLESVGASIVTLASGAAGTRTLFSGSLNTISEFWRIGSLRLCENVSAQSSGAISALLKPFTIVASGLATGGTVDCLFDLVVNAGIANGSLVHITLIGANYRYSHLGIVTLANGAGGSNSIAMLANTIAFNTSGWGVTTFTIDANAKLVLTNAAGGFSVTAYVAVSPVGYYML